MHSEICGSQAVQKEQFPCLTNHGNFAAAAARKIPNLKLLKRVFLTDVSILWCVPLLPQEALTEEASAAGEEQRARVESGEEFKQYKLVLLFKVW